MCITKVCTKCPENGEQPIEMFYKGKGYCKLCTKKRVSKWRKNNIAKHKERQRILYEKTKNDKEYKKARNKRQSDYRKRHPEKVKIYQGSIKEKIMLYIKKWKTNNPITVAIQQKRKRESLRKGYIVSLLKQKGLLYSEMPTELIELQKEAIQLYRQLKTMQNGSTE